MPRGPNDRPTLDAGGGEEALIAEFWAPLTAGAPGAYGLKDDCATIAPPAGMDLVVTTDALIAGVHFFPDEDPAAVAWKALAVNVSDLVAKGAAPLAYMLTVALPRLDREWLQAFTSGLRAAQEAFGCQLVGGDTDRTPGPLGVTIAAFGTVPQGRMVRRGTARPGDRVYVTGTIGDATLGLALRRDREGEPGCNLDDAARRFLEERFSRPRPPVRIAPVLRACASAAMDISDGLMKDFDRLCRASGVAGRIESFCVPLSQPAQDVIATGYAKLEDLMSGGEDYEVLAAVPLDRTEEFERLATAAGVPVTPIGALAEGPAGGVAVSVSGAPMVFQKAGWDHFSQS